MKHNLDKFVPLEIKDFAKKMICDGHLYLRGREDKRFYLMKPGILIDENFIKKYASSQAVFDYLPVTDHELVAKFTELFRELKYLRFEKDLKRKSLDILALFRESYQSEHHFLSFALACHQEFCGLRAEEMKLLHETDVHLFRKALYTAAFAVIIAFSNDHFHYPMIKDFYNLAMCLDMGLCESSFSYFVAEACNKENQEPGTSLEWMRRERASELEINTFLKHPEKSHQYLKERADLFSYPELIEAVLYQHELSNGKGFPRGVLRGHVSSWEAILILADSLVEIKDEYDFENHVISFVCHFNNKKLEDLPVQRVHRKFCMAVGFNLEKEDVG